LGTDPKQAANWIMGEVMGHLSAGGIEAKDMALTPETLAHLIQLVQSGTLNRNTAVKVFDAVFDCNGDVDAYVQAHGLEQVHDVTLIRQAVGKVFAENQKSVADYKAGKEKAFGYLVGQVMRELKGKADPKAVNQAVQDSLSGQSG